MILSSFGGIIPRLAEHMLALNQATIAHDVNLRNGVLESWREPCEFAVVPAGSKTYHLHGCCVLAWDCHRVSVAELTPDWGRIYITGRDCNNGLEAISIDSCCNVSYIKVGVPAPVSPPSATGGEECSRTSHARSYVYTYVTQWGEESPPSPPSNVIRVNDGSVVNVLGIIQPPEGYGVQYINLYRTASGFRVPDGKVQQQKTDYLLVATFPVGTTSYADGQKNITLGPVLETQYDRPPPAELHGVVSISDQVRLAGYKKNRIFFSEQFQPHNWPAKYDLTLDYNIVHMGVLDQRLFVTTDSIPYIIDVSSCDATKCTPVTAFDLPLPDIGCHYAHGAIMTHHGMMYASPFGIILIQPNGQWHILTARWFGEKEWLKLRPDTIRMAYWEGYLFFATDMATFLLNINGKPYGDMEGAELCTLTDKPVDMLTTNTGKLTFLQDNKIWVWDGGTKRRPYVWKSRQITAKSLQGSSELKSPMPDRDYMWWPAAIKLNGSATVTVEDSHGHPYYSHTLATEKPLRLPKHGRHLWYRVRFDSDAPVNYLAMGTSISSVNRGE